MTPQEAKLWNALRALRRTGLHFRRQVPIGPFIADFACLKHRLLIELDGGQHSRDQRASMDKSRDAHLLELGFRTLRFWNAEIDTNLEGVIDTILSQAQGMPNGNLALA
jgi:very-short-patch-repair endonuclease